MCDISWSFACWISCNSCYAISLNLCMYDIFWLLHLCYLVTLTCVISHDNWMYNILWYLHVWYVLILTCLLSCDSCMCDISWYLHIKDIKWCMCYPISYKKFCYWFYIANLLIYSLTISLNLQLIFSICSNNNFAKWNFQWKMLEKFSWGLKKKWTSRKIFTIYRKKKLSVCPISCGTHFKYISTLTVNYNFSSFFVLHQFR